MKLALVLVVVLVLLHQVEVVLYRMSNHSSLILHILFVSCHYVLFIIVDVEWEQQEEVVEVVEVVHSEDAEDAEDAEGKETSK
jgi:hypothetical protein